MAEVGLPQVFSEVYTTICDQIYETSQTANRLTAILNKLQRHILNCKIARTSGNSTSIAGTGILFTPLALIGLGMLVLGGATSLGTVITQHALARKLVREFNKVIGEHSKIEFTFSTNMARISTELVKLTQVGYRFGKTTAEAVKIARVFSEATSAKAVLSISGASKGAAILGLGRVGVSTGILPVVGAAVSAIDLVITWTTRDETLIQLRQCIDNLSQRQQEIEEIKSNLEEAMKPCEEGSSYSN